MPLPPVRELDKIIQQLPQHRLPALPEKYLWYKGSIITLEPTEYKANHRVDPEEDLLVWINGIAPDYVEYWDNAKDETVKVAPLKSFDTIEELLNYMAMLCWTGTVNPGFIEENNDSTQTRPDARTSTAL